MPAGPVAGFSLDSGWRLHPQVAVRPEPFGALLYHFGSRRLSFLKDAALTDVVRALPEHPTARAACVAAGLPDTVPTDVVSALETLARTGMIEPMIDPAG